MARNINYSDGRCSGYLPSPWALRGSRDAPGRCPNERRARRSAVHVIRSGPFVVELDERLGGEITRIQHDDRELLATYDWASPVRVSRSRHLR